MNISRFSFLLHKPAKVNGDHAQDLEKVIEAYPYFQPARALELKALKEEKSFKYNNALKVAAAYTRDRSILFEFITSKTFIQDQVANRIMQMAPGIDITELEVNDLEEVIVKDNKTAFDFNEVNAEAVMDPELFSPKATEAVPAPTAHNTTEEEVLPSPTDEEAPDKPSEISLELGKPLEFDRSETHSFSEWLQLSDKFKPIVREEETPQVQTTEKPAPKESKTPKKKEIPEPKKQGTQGGLETKLSLIDKFIENNPKISPVSKDANPTLSVKDNTPPPHQLMTETLARVYLEQKKYKKAIQAYKILSLKYPEKSGLFADQIKAIKNLKDSNK